MSTFQFLTNVQFNHSFQDSCKSFSLKVLLSLALLRSEEYNTEYGTTDFLHAILYTILKLVRDGVKTGNILSLNDHRKQQETAFNSRANRAIHRSTEGCKSGSIVPKQSFTESSSKKS